MHASFECEWHALRILKQHQMIIIILLEEQKLNNKLFNFFSRHFAVFNYEIQN